MKARTLIVAAAVVAAAACGRSRHEAAAAAPTAPLGIDVATAIVSSVDQTEVYEAGGVVRARTTATITSRLLAPVQDVFVAAGVEVRRGQILLRLDDRDLAAQQRRAAAGRLAAAQGARAADAERDAARSALALASAYDQRIVSLHQRASATDDELDRALEGRRAAEARMALADARAAEASAALASAVAAEDAARIGTSWAAITAPFDGVITETLVEPGNMAVPGAPLLRMEQGGAMRADVRLDESRAVGVSVGDSARVLVDRGAVTLRVDGCVAVGSSRVDLQACKLEYSIVSPK